MSTGSFFEMIGNNGNNKFHQHHHPSETAPSKSSPVGVDGFCVEATAPAAAASPKQKHAHRHVQAVLDFENYCGEEEQKFEKKEKLISPSLLQVVTDGSTLTAKALRSGQTLKPNVPILIQDSPESIGMKLPRPSSGDKDDIDGPRLSVRDIADVVGHAMPVHVIDVEHQEELEGWVMYDLVEYFEDEERLLTAAAASRWQEQQQKQLDNSNDNPAQQQQNRRSRRRRQAATSYANHDEKSTNDDAQKAPRVLNQISFEFSQTHLRKMVESPQFVRDLDWIDHAWSPDWRSGTKRGSTTTTTTAQHYPSVQYYCLTSSAGCYTDWHLDFGGTSVWYHVASGRKVFMLIAPTEENLIAYEQWLCRKDQGVIFLPELIEHKSTILKTTLEEGQTFFIPSGWIHAVYTPCDSLVFGGNFLHGLDIETQLASYSIEVRARVKDRFRFPYFIPLQFYTGGLYFNKLRQGDICQRELDQLPVLMDALETWWKFHSSSSGNDDISNMIQFLDAQNEPTPLGAALEVARLHECSTFDMFLSKLREEHACLVRDGIPLAPKNSVLLPPAPNGSGVSPRVKVKLNIYNKNKKINKLSAPSLVPENNNNDEDEENATQNEFRIRLSSAALKAVSLPKGMVIARKKCKEDVLDDCDLPDDEWVPSSSSKRRSAPRRPHSSPAAKKKAKTTTTTTTTTISSSSTANEDSVFEIDPSNNNSNNSSKTIKQSKAPTPPPVSPSASKKPKAESQTTPVSRAKQPPKTTARQRLLSKLR